ncbi:septal ring lytic transglycosylase RlpA family protein [Litorimonas sp. WD9-15]|uniref:septal ring lytic transglycosylase RlpA family protein n=1 Tax=Litorimonas sp. WD9-15 TaxID=3418716 RepID=UPI003D05BB8F
MVSTKQVLIGVLAVTLGLSVSGCASTSISKSVKAAPITYKIGDGATKYASLSTPRAPMKRAVPESYIPARPMPAPQAQQSFDQASVDKDLYKHQRLGKRYKIRGKSYTPKHQPDYDVTGVASWYGPKFHGKPTATGETFDQNALTAAHKTLPLNSMLFVTNVENGKTLMVRLNDRGPFVGDRIIDLSQASAKALGITGLGQVRVQYAGPADPMAANRAPVRAPVPVERPQENFVEAPYTAPTPAPSMPFSPPEPAPYTPAAPVAPSAPQAVQPDTVDPSTGNVTLTIKGPIHIASHKGPQPRLIRERVKTK